jgi:integrase
MGEKHSLMGGKLNVYKRENSDCWQCSTYLAGKNHRASTKEESLSKAKDFAEDWFLELHGKFKRGEVKEGKTFKFASEQFVREYGVITQGERSPQYVSGNADRIRVHLNPFFGNKVLSEITSGLVQEYRAYRMTSRLNPKTGEPQKPARSTLHQEIVTLRQILKLANRHGWLQSMPDLSPPYKSSGKVAHRGWFSPDEYRQLYEATRERAKNPPKPRWRWQCEQLHDYVLFMANTGLRPDEAARLEYRDVEIVDDQDTQETILEIEVRGKRGVGFCKSMPGAVTPFKRLLARNEPKPNDKIFPKTHRELLNNVLGELGMKTDRDGQK